MHYFTAVSEDLNLKFSGGNVSPDPPILLTLTRSHLPPPPPSPQHHLKIRSAGPKNEDRFKLTKQVLNMFLLCYWCEWAISLSKGPVSV